MRAPVVLDFDIENRPLSYLGSDFTTSEITAIAAGIYPVQESITSKLLKTPDSALPMLEWFVELWNLADVVTGHYILAHDIPIINGALTEHRMPNLKPKLVSDTKIHGHAGKGISKSQESLSDILGVEAEKYHMTQARWRDANRLTFTGLVETRTRVEGDVHQHMLMRAEMIRLGKLGRPVLWEGPRS
jgi:hypothetical protein